MRGTSRGVGRVARIAAAGAATLAAATGAAAYAVRKNDIHLVRGARVPALVRTVRTEDGEPIRVLQQGGVYQSATYLGERRFEPVFAYYRAFDVMFQENGPDAAAADSAPGIHRVLMLGGGGFSYPKHLLTTRCDVRLDVVEVDPAVVAAARRWFFLDELERRLASPATARGNSLRIIEADARAFLESASVVGPSAQIAQGDDWGEPCPLPRPSWQYDAIVNDVFSGGEPVRTVATVQAALAARACLQKDGLYLANVVSREEGRDLSFLRDEVATLRQAFAHVHVIPCPDDRFGGEDNYLVVATDSSRAFEDAIPYDDDFPGTALFDIVR